jgi:hypothetical protein
VSIQRISAGCALAGALVLLAGCAGSSGSTTKTGSSGTTTKSTPAASPTPTVTPATVAELRKIVLQATDLPGWKPSPAEPDSSSSADQAQLMACVGAKNTDADQVATTDSDDFNLGDATISSSASSYKSQSDLDSDLALLKNPKLVPCFNQQFQKYLATSMPEGAGVGAVSVKFTPGSTGGPANVVGSGSAAVPVTVNGQQVTVYIDFVYVTGPLIEAEVDAENVGAPVPAAVLQAAVKAVATRAASQHVSA